MWVGLILTSDRSTFEPRATSHEPRATSHEQIGIALAVAVAGVLTSLFWDCLSQGAKRDAC